MSLEPFPTVLYTEFTAARHFTAPGLFFYRQMQARQLLHFPDFAGGDLSREQRKVALLQMVNAQRPLAALALFLGVVALEDFIRDLGSRLADTPGLDNYFPLVANLRPKPLRQPRPYARTDKDPATFSDWPATNALYNQVLGINPFLQSDLPKLHDLAIIRHTVAHHAALIREIDVPRFKFWSMQANTQINPPAEFVQATSLFIYQVGRTFEKSVADRVFDLVIPHESSNWCENPSELLLSLIELFNWFGILLTEQDDDISSVFGEPNYEKEVRLASASNRAQLNHLSLAELSLRYTT